MKRMYALSGPPGAGKTHHRMNDPDLCLVPFIDIADLYGQGADLSAVQWVFLRAVELAMQVEDELVVEAAFLPGSPQRKNFIDLAARIGAEIVWIELDAPFDVLEERVKGDYQKAIGGPNEQDALRYYQARLRLIRSLQAAARERFAAQRNLRR